MFKKVLTKFTPVIILIFLLGCGTQPTTPPVTDSAAASSLPLGVIVLADISDEPAEAIESFQPLADYLAANLNEYGIGVGEVKVAPDMATMAQWMADGKVDLYFDSPYPAITVSETSGAQPILRRWKGGEAEYQTVFITRNDSGISSLQELNGHMIGFEESFSTSGYMLPMAFLVEMDLQPVEKPSPNTAVAADEIGYVFTDDHENTIIWTLSGKVPVGAVSQQALLEIPEESRAELKVLAETESLARHVALVQPGMDPELVEAVKSLLESLDETARGQEILNTFEETAKFDEFPEGAPAALARMKELYQLVQSNQP